MNAHNRLQKSKIASIVFTKHNKKTTPMVWPFLLVEDEIGFEPIEMQQFG